MKDFLLNAWRCVTAFASDIFWRLLFRPKGLGLENIPKTGNVIIACNHLSHFDPMFVGYYVLNSFGRFSSRQIWNPAKEELFNVPVVGLLIRSYRAFPIKRGKGDLQSLERMTTLAKQHVVIIYPEGTRSKDGKLQPGKAGVGKIIHDSRAQVVPAALFNTQYCLPKGAKRPRFFLPLSVVFGKPVDLSKYMDLPDSKETSQLIINDVMAAIAKLQKEYAHLDLENMGKK